MKKVIKEVKDLKPIISQHTLCLVISIILAFFIDAIPFAFGIPLWLWFVIYLVLIIYSYLTCTMIYIFITPSSRRVRKADIDAFLY